MGYNRQNHEDNSARQRDYWHQIQLSMLISGLECEFNYTDNADCYHNRHNRRNRLLVPRERSSDNHYDAWKEYIDETRIHKFTPFDERFTSSILSTLANFYFGYYIWQLLKIEYGNDPRWNRMKLFTPNTNYYLLSDNTQRLLRKLSAG